MEQCKAEQAGQVAASAKVAPFILAFVAKLIMAWALYGILVHMDAFTLRAGIISGALIWFGFVLTTLAVNYAFSGRKADAHRDRRRLLARRAAHHRRDRRRMGAS